MSFFVASHTKSVPPKPAEIKYERNPVGPQKRKEQVIFIYSKRLTSAQVLNPPVQSLMPPQAPRQSEPAQTFGSRQGPPPPSFGTSSMQQQPAVSQQSVVGGQSFGQQGYAQGAPPPLQQHERSFSMGQSSQPPPSQYNNSPVGRGGPPPPQSYKSGPIGSSGPPQLSSLPFQNSAPLSSTFPPGSGFPAQPSHQQTFPVKQTPSANATNLPPLKPVFGMTLEQLFERDGSAVPMVVYQCIQAVDLYGLEVEGIYRLSGTSSHVNKIKAMFDNGK